VRGLIGAWSHPLASVAGLEVLAAALSRKGPGAEQTLHAVAPPWTSLASLALPAVVGPSVLAVNFKVRAGCVGIALWNGDGALIEERQVGVGAETCWFALPGGSSALRLVIRTRGVETEQSVVVTFGGAFLHPVEPVPNDNTFLSVFEVDQRAANLSFVPHLLASEARRRATGASGMTVLVIEESPIGAALLPKDFADAYPSGARADFVHTDIPLIADMMPSVNEVVVTRDCAAARCSMLASRNRYPGGPLTSAATDFSSAFSATSLAAADARLSAGPSTSALVSQWLDGVFQGGGPFLTFTPRLASYAVEMNTDIALWSQWFSTMPNEGVILVPDFRSGAPESPEGPWVPFPFKSPEAIVALYERASANLAMYGELALLLMATSAPFTVWVEVDEESAYLSTDALTAVGLPPGEQPPLLLPNQHIVFQPPGERSLQAVVATSQRD
jgi:hypothetical protein